jgi:hypothetical protein
MQSDIDAKVIGSFQIERRISRFALSIIYGMGPFDAFRQNNNGKFYYLEPSTGTLSIIGLRGNYYLVNNKTFDLYAGIFASYLYVDADMFLEGEYVNTKYRNGIVGTVKASDNNGFKPGFQLGAHYWIANRFGFWGEAAYGTSLFNIGIALRK